MKVPVILRYLWVAGAPKIACYQVMGLRDLGYDAKLKVLAVSPRYRGEYNQLLKRIPYTIVKTPRIICDIECVLNRFIFGEFREGERALPIYALIKSIGNMRRSQALLCHDPFSGVLGYLHKKLYGTPYIVYVHEMPFGNAPFKFMEKTVLNASDMILTVSDKISKLLKNGYIKGKKVKALPPGLPVEVKNISSLQNKIARTRKYVLTAARWDLFRRPDWIIETAKRLKGLDFIVLGYWQSRSLFIEFLKKTKNLNNIMIFKHTVSEQELKHLVRNALAVVRLNIIGESLAMIAWEAVHAGTPVIVNSDLGVADYINEFRAGIVIPRVEPTLIVDAIKELMSDYKFYVEGCVRLAQYYNVRNHAERLAEILNDIT